VNGSVAWSIENSNPVQIAIFRDRLLSANQRLFRITPAPCVIVGNNATRQIVNHIRRYPDLPLRCWPAPIRAARFASSLNKSALWKPARLEQTKVNLFPYCTRPRHRRTGQEFRRTPGRHIGLQGPATRYADEAPRSIYQSSLTLRTLMLRLEAPTKAAVRGRGPPVARARGAALACMTAS
jgi:hypothetical protein